jgi:aryl-alcohol dehydrogenase-like predicted oxidoreductase
MTELALHSPSTRHPQEEPSVSAMRHITRGTLDVSRTGLGAMSRSGCCGNTDLDGGGAARTHRALDLGVTLIDTAEA